MTTSDGGANIGAASFGIGLDLAQLERDLDRAEQLTRARAERIQSTVGAIPVGAPASKGGFSPSQGSPAPGAASPAASGSGAGTRTFPPYMETLYQHGISTGMSPQAARSAVARTLQLRAAEVEGLGEGGGSGSVGPSFSPPNGTPPPGATAAPRGRPPAPRATPAGRGARGPGHPAASGGGPLEAIGLGGSQGIARTVGAIVGIGAGLNVAVTAAAKLHEAIAAAAEAGIQLVQSSREVGVAFGAGAGAITGPGAAAFVGNPQTAGTAGQYLSLVASLAPLQAQFGLTGQQIQQVAVQSGVLARLWGTDLATAGKVLQDVLRGNLQAGAALNLNLTDQFGALKTVGLTYNELAAAVGPAAATQKVLAAAQAEVDRQLRNNGQSADQTALAFDRFGKTVDSLKTKLAELAKAPVAAAANIGTVALGGNVPTDTRLAQTPEEVQARLVLGTAGERQQAKDLVEAQRIAKIRANIPATFAGAPGSPGSATERGTGFQRDAGLTSDEVRQADVDRATSAARLRGSQAGIRGTIAQSQLDTLGAQSDLRRLGVQQQINDLATQRLDIENRLVGPLLEQQRVQDRITLTTRDNLTLTEATLRAQQAAIPSSNASFELSFQQQKVRLQAQAQFSRALRGLPPVAGVGGIPELFGQARDLALAAPEVDLAALLAQHPADVAARAQSQAAGARQLGAIPDAKRLQALQDQLIPLGQARSAAQAAGDAIERSLQGADLVSGPDRIKAERDLANARIQQADAAAQIARAQSDAGGLSATANVTITGLTDVQAATASILDSLRPVIEASIRAAVTNNQPIPGVVGTNP